MSEIYHGLAGHPRLLIRAIIMTALLLAIAAEVLCAQVLRRPLFNGADTWVNVKMFAAYNLIFWGLNETLMPLLHQMQQVAPFNLGQGWARGDASWGTWLALFLAVDLSYYLYHRACHSWRFFWASHVGHHSSPYFNLTTGIRQPAVALFPAFSWLPLSLVGFNPNMVALMASLNLNYQIFLHTQLVNRLGPLEWIFNTPSHHRAHHACNAGYVDKNLGGVLIVWDRLFGTFAQEREQPAYGLGDGKPHLSAWENSFAEFRSMITGNPEPKD